MPRPLADLHLHLYGAIPADDYLDDVAGRAIDWSRYEAAHVAAYGRASPVRDVLARHAAGDVSARADWQRLFVFGPEDAGNFARFQAKFDLLIAGSVFALLDDPAADPEPVFDELRRVVRYVLDAQARQGVTYAEHRMLFASHTPAARVRQACEVILEAFAADTRGTTRLALSLPRADPWPAWHIARELVLSPLGAGFTGIDFCFFEEGFPPEDKAALFAAVHEFNRRHPERALAILYHVGESFTDKSLESAVRWVVQAAELGAHRLGHAIALGVDPDAYGAHVRHESVAERLDQIAWDVEHAEGLEGAGVEVDEPALERERRALEGRAPGDRLEVSYDAPRLAALRRRQGYAIERVRQSGAIVEVCPSSNLRIGGLADPRHHPVHCFLAAGLPFVVASDDPGIFGTTLREELAWVARETGLDSRQLDALAERSFACRSERLTGRE